MRVIRVVAAVDVLPSPRDPMPRLVEARLPPPQGVDVIFDERIALVARLRRARANARPRHLNGLRRLGGGVGGGGVGTSMTRGVEFGGRRLTMASDLTTPLVAVVNAGILKKMSAFWQKIFLTVGVVIAVFGMRLVFPILIVSITAPLRTTLSTTMTVPGRDNCTAH